MEPWRARPVPFWRHGLAPPPRTWARVRVLALPARRAASWAVTTWCMTGTLGSMPNHSSSSVAVPAFLPEALFTSMLAMSDTCLHGVTDDHQAAVGARDRPLDQDQVALGVGLDHLEVLRGHLGAAGPPGHPGALEHAGRGGAGA